MLLHLGGKTHLACAFGPLTYIRTIFMGIKPALCVKLVTCFKYKDSLLCLNLTAKIQNPLNIVVSRQE